MTFQLFVPKFYVNFKFNFLSSYLQVLIINLYHGKLFTLMTQRAGWTHSRFLLSDHQLKKHFICVQKKHFILQFIVIQLYSCIYFLLCFPFALQLQNFEGTGTLVTISSFGSAMRQVERKARPYIHEMLICQYAVTLVYRIKPTKLHTQQLNSQELLVMTKGLLQTIFCSRDAPGKKDPESPEHL